MQIIWFTVIQLYYQSDIQVKAGVVELLDLDNSTQMNEFALNR